MQYAVSWVPATHLLDVIGIYTTLRCWVSIIHGAESVVTSFSTLQVWLQLWLKALQRD